MLISFTIALSVCVFEFYGTKGIKNNKESVVVNYLRQQLMQENYDYTLESNETQTINMRADIKLDKYNSKDEFNKKHHINNTSEKKEISSQSKHTTSKFNYFTHSKEIDNSQMTYDKTEDKINHKPPEHPISVKDLLYYMDEEKVLKDKLGPETREMNARRSMDYKPTVKKFKVLKMRHNHRRSNPRHFIQEEGEDRVVIINLDNGTFPQFRLPRSRRQYMHDHGEVVAEEEEIPPPPVSEDFVTEGDTNALTKVQV